MHVAIGGRTIYNPDTVQAHGSARNNKSEVVGHANKTSKETTTPTLIAISQCIQVQRR